MTYKDLIVWQKSMDLAEEIYVLTNRFPNHELYGLTNQMRRASISIPSNIAEGQGRGSEREFSRFLNIAHGSLAELETQLLLSIRLGYITNDEVSLTQYHMEEIGKMLRGLIRKFRQEGIYTRSLDPTLQSPISDLQSQRKDTQ